MTDRELLEFAAKAAGVELTWREPSCGGGDLPYVGWGSYAPTVWNPLTDDGDALRLAVKLLMTVRCYMGTTVAQIGTPGLKNAYEDAFDHDDHAAATRRAIVRAAAAIGKEMP